VVAVVGAVVFEVVVLAIDGVVIIAAIYVIIFVVMWGQGYCMPTLRLSYLTSAEAGIRTHSPVEKN